MLHIPLTNLLLLAAKQEPYKKVYLLTKNIEEFSEKSSEEWTSRQKKRSDRKSNRTRQKNKRGYRKVESNDSPEILEQGETSDIPSLPSRMRTDGYACNCTWGCTDTVREFALKVNLGEKSFAALGNRTCISSMPVNCSTN